MYLAQLSKYNLWERCSHSHPITLAYLLKINWTNICGLISRLHFALMIYGSIKMPVPHCLDYSKIYSNLLLHLVGNLIRRAKTQSLRPHLALFSEEIFSNSFYFSIPSLWVKGIFNESNQMREVKWRNNNYHKSIRNRKQI